MSFLVGFLLVVLVLVSLFLILIVLVQDDGADGAGMLFGSSASQQYGAKRGNIVTRTTGILAVAFILISLSLTFLFKENETNLQAIEATSLEESSEASDSLEWWKEGTESTEENGESNPVTIEEVASTEEDNVDKTPNTDKQEPDDTMMVNTE